MKNYDSMTDGMFFLRDCWSRFGAHRWISFSTDPDKLEALADKWAEVYGTRLPPERRHYRRKKGLPVAWACSLPVLYEPRPVVFLLASPEASEFGPDTPWGREKWRSDPYKLSDLYEVYQHRNAAKELVWTWGFQDRQLGIMRAWLKDHVIRKDARQIAEVTRRWVSLHPMFSGVRTEMRRMFCEAAKLWQARNKTPWPGPDPEALPSMGQFRKRRCP